MPGPQIKNWKVYHALRKHGASKKKAARIANAKKKSGKKGRRR